MELPPLKFSAYATGLKCLGLIQGRNQKRENRAIAPPEIFANMVGFVLYM